MNPNFLANFILFQVKFPYFPIQGMKMFTKNLDFTVLINVNEFIGLIVIILGLLILDGRLIKKILN